MFSPSFTFCLQIYLALRFFYTFIYLFFFFGFYPHCNVWIITSNSIQCIHKSGWLCGELILCNSMRLLLYFKIQCFQRICIIFFEDSRNLCEWVFLSVFRITISLEFFASFHRSIHNHYSHGFLIFGEIYRYWYAVSWAVVRESFSNLRYD